jgi:hypothetical protein
LNFFHELLQVIRGTAFIKVEKLVGGAEAAYSVRGQLRAYSGDLKGGDEDMSVAENFGRKGSSPGVLKRDLQFHADLLNRLNRPEEAQAKLDEAAKL